VEFIVSTMLYKILNKKFSLKLIKYVFNFSIFKLVIDLLNVVFYTLRDIYTLDVTLLPIILNYQ
jgi:hypothetical protein